MSVFHLKVRLRAYSDYLVFSTIPDFHIACLFTWKAKQVIMAYVDVGTVETAVSTVPDLAVTPCILSNCPNVCVYTIIYGGETWKSSFRKMKIYLGPTR